MNALCQSSFDSNTATSSALSSSTKGVLLSSSEGIGNPNVIDVKKGLTTSGLWERKEEEKKDIEALVNFISIQCFDVFSIEILFLP
jgi:hypothetical protein